MGIPIILRSVQRPPPPAGGVVSATSFPSNLRQDCNTTGLLDCFTALFLQASIAPRAVGAIAYAGRETFPGTLDFAYALLLLCEEAALSRVYERKF